MFLRQHFREILVIRESMRIQDVFTTRFKDANVVFFFYMLVSFYKFSGHNRREMQCIIKIRLVLDYFSRL